MHLPEGIIALLLTLLPIAAIGLADIIIRNIKDLQRNLDCINLEIERTDGLERQCWMRKKRKVLLSLIPFAAWFMRRKE